MAYHDWHVGMKVVCIEPDKFGRLTEGRVYTLTSIRAGDFTDAITRAPASNEIGVVVAEAEPHCGGYFRARKFRPAQQRKTDISIFTAMLNPQKQVVDA